VYVWFLALKIIVCLMIFRVIQYEVQYADHIYIVQFVYKKHVNRN